ncbi:hypothetical protein J6590_015535 [Homalodisca vitripennis]|nr:hypothetical protein J6590_015535 [Homalodisca vitripennis]
MVVVCVPAGLYIATVTGRRYENTSKPIFGTGPGTTPLTEVAIAGVCLSDSI